MNDYEVDVFDTVYEAVVPSLLADGNFRSEYVAEYESLPLATLVRMDSIPYWRRESTADAEDLTIDTYELNVFAESTDECRNIANAIAERMRQMNFRRLSMMPVMNGNDIRVKRIVARFEHCIDSQGRMYRP